MSRNSYTASERRGLLAIAILALLLIGGGVTLSLCGRPHTPQKEIPVIVTHPEMKDTVTVKKTHKVPSKKRKETQRSLRKSDKKVYRQRRPLDEPI